MRFTDSHCHLTDRAFRVDRDDVLERAGRAGVSRVVTIASDADDSLAALEMACGHRDLWCSAGVHPHAVNDAIVRAGLAAVRDVAQHPRCVAIGETGLDYYYDNAPRSAQRRSFLRHVDLAAEMRLPLVVHTRNAEADTAATIRDFTGWVTGVLHCFTGSMELLELAMDAGWCVSFTGVVTFKGFDPELVRRVPSGRYMIETDSPYLAPVPMRGRRNEPAFLPHVAAAVAGIRGESLEQAAEDTWANAIRFFGLEGKPNAARRIPGPAAAPRSAAPGDD